MQLRKQSAWSETRPEFYFWRTASGQEVDIVLEDSAGRLVGIEIKAGATLGGSDIKGLQAMARAAGKRWVRGVVLTVLDTDGCDPEACQDVLIADCTFDTGDDCIAIKSGRNNDGRRIGTPSENIVIRPCRMQEGHGGVTIGSEISGGGRNVFVEDCTMNSPNLDRAIRFKSNAVRGGLIENIFVRIIRVGVVADAALQIDFLYEEGSNGPHKPVVRNLIIERLQVEKAKRVLDVRGFPGAEISGVRIYDSSCNGISKPDTVLEADVKLINSTVRPAKGARPSSSKTPNQKPPKT